MNPAPIRRLRGGVFLFLLAAAGAFGAAPSAASSPSGAAAPALAEPDPRAASPSRPLRSQRPDTEPAPQAGAVPGTAGNPTAPGLPDPGYLTRRPPEDGLSIPIPWENQRFRKFRDAFLSPGGRTWLETVSARSAPYASYVYERIRWYRLPEELFFLPVIESEWSPRAVSRSGAAGLWQFMRNSIAGYDMRIDEWVDERRDFMKSTDAALRKLRTNYEALGSWELALAAYNAGLGAVSRAAAAGGTRDYWELSDRGLLTPEAVNYVPKFLAAVSVLGRAGRNGLAVPDTPPAAWERVDLDRPVDLALLSEAAGIPLPVLRIGNPELRYDVTPPEGKYALKVPAREAGAVREILARPDFQALRFYRHTVRSGDTLSALARHYEVTVALILRLNPGVRPEALRIGSTLVIPALKEKGPYAPPAPSETLDFSESYVVARGDTLWAISLRYGVQPETLAERNGLDISSIIREGMTLKVPKME